MEPGGQGKTAASRLPAVFRDAPVKAIETTIICGHWSQLGLKVRDKQAGLDSGCVWGGKLTAMRLEDRQLYQVSCKGYQAPGGE
jgi:hypothetical protein